MDGAAIEGYGDVKLSKKLTAQMLFMQLLELTEETSNNTLIKHR